MSRLTTTAEEALYGEYLAWLRVGDGDYLSGSEYAPPSRAMLEGSIQAWQAATDGYRDGWEAAERCHRDQ